MKPPQFSMLALFKKKNKNSDIFFLKPNNTKTTGIIYDRSSVSPQSSETLFLSKNQNLLLPPKIQNHGHHIRSFLSLLSPQKPSFSPKIKTFSFPQKSKIKIQNLGWERRKSHISLHLTNQGKEPGTMMQKPEFLMACKVD